MSHKEPLLNSTNMLSHDYSWKSRVDFTASYDKNTGSECFEISNAELAKFLRLMAAENSSGFDSLFLDRAAEVIENLED